jgi:hypothetical protein
MKTFPKRSRTLSNKIRKNNPWGFGNELGDLIDLHWDSIKQANTLDFEWFVALTKRKYLAASYVLSVINKEYL